MSLISENVSIPLVDIFYSYIGFVLSPFESQFVFVSGIKDLQEFVYWFIDLGYMESQLWSVVRIRIDKSNIYTPHDYNRLLNYLFKKTAYFNVTSERCNTIEDLINDRSLDEINHDLIYFNTYLFNLDCLCRCPMIID